MRSHGIRGKILDWITEWLKGRKQKVGIRGVLSDWVEVLSGVTVPHWSVLGLLLFLIYINDLEFGIDNWILKFADDTEIFTRITDNNDWHSLQDDLTKLTTWSEKWQMLFNTSKCKVMHIGKLQKNIHIIWIISSLKKLLNRKIWVSWLVIILKSGNSVSQHVPKQWEFWELSTVLLCSDIRILCYVSTSHWSYSSVVPSLLHSIGLIKIREIHCLKVEIHMAIYHKNL